MFSLMRAARRGDTARLSSLLNTVDPNAKINNFPYHGVTALIMASTWGHVVCAEIIISKGARVDEKDNLGTTALMHASRRGRTGCIALLITKGADPNEKTKYGETALMIASEEGHIECVRLLLSNGARINEKNESGVTALMRASCHGNFDCAELLITEGARLDEQNENGWTALMWAGRRSHIECVWLLIENGADATTTRDNEGRTAIDHAFEEEVKDMMTRAPQIRQDFLDRAGGPPTDAQRVRELEARVKALRAGLHREREAVSRLQSILESERSAWSEQLAEELAEAGKD